jgi:hypothetical protein
MPARKLAVIAENAAIHSSKMMAKLGTLVHGNVTVHSLHSLSRSANRAQEKEDVQARLMEHVQKDSETGERHQQHGARVVHRARRMAPGLQDASSKKDPLLSELQLLLNRIISGVLR